MKKDIKLMFLVCIALAFVCALVTTILLFITIQTTHCSFKAFVMYYILYTLFFGIMLGFLFVELLIKDTYHGE